VVQVKFPGLAKRYELRDHGNWWATAHYLSWRTGKDWTVADVDQLVRQGKIALDERGYILTESVKRFLIVSAARTLSAEELTQVVKDMHDTVGGIANLMVKLVNKVELIAAIDRPPIRCPHAPKRRKS